MRAPRLVAVATVSTPIAVMELCVDACAAVATVATVSTPIAVMELHAGVCAVVAAVASHARVPSSCGRPQASQWSPSMHDGYQRHALRAARFHGDDVELRAGAYVTAAAQAIRACHCPPLQWG